MAALRRAAAHLKALPVTARAVYDAPRSVTSAVCLRNAEMEDILVDDTPKQGWGGTLIHDVLLAKQGDQGAWLWCSKDDLVLDAIKKMTRGNVGSLLVFDPAKINFSGSESGLKSAASDAVEGIVTERDYLTKVVVLGKSSSELHVKDIMTAKGKLMTVTPQHSVVEVMELMINNNFRHVPVVEQGNYLGMVSIRDVVKVMVQEHHEEVGGLREYISGGY